MIERRGGYRPRAAREVAGYTWTKEELMTLQRVASEGGTARDATEALPVRTDLAVRKRARTMGLNLAHMRVGSPPGPGRRGKGPPPMAPRISMECLSCGNEFLSRCRIHNRLCTKCSTESDVFFGWP